jgi:hypothetical protein
MDEMSVTTLGSGAKTRPEPLNHGRRASRYLAEADWKRKELQDFLDEEARAPTLRERLENWGSD